jgi:hypothetical protein
MMLGQIDPALEAALAEQFAGLDKQAQALGFSSFETQLAASFTPTLVDSRTPDSLVPDTEAGKAYKALPDVTREMARRILAVFEERDVTGPLSVPYAQRVENLSKALLLGPFNVDFGAFSRGDWQANFVSYAERPIFAWKKDAPLIQIEYRGLQIPVPFQSDNGNALIAPPFLVFLLSQGAFNLVAYDSSIGFFDKFGNYSTVFSQNFKVAITADENLSPLNQFPGVTYHVLDLLRNVKSVVAQIEKAESRAFLTQAVIAFLAFASLPFAITAIETGGWTLANSVKLLATIDRIPGVDFGVASNLLSIVNRAYSGVGSVVSNIAESSAQTVADQGVNMDVFESGYSEVTSPESYWSGVNLDVPDIGSTIDSLASQTTSFDWSKFVTDLAKTYAQYDLTKRKLEQHGQPAPPPRAPVGSTRQLPDGSTATVNSDGTTTIKRPTGEVVTVRRDGSIVQGGGDLIPGIPNVALFGGAAVLLALFLFRRGR